MNQREQIAKAMYEAPDVGDDQVHPWPPSHPNDVAWWISRADAALAVFDAGYSKEFRVAESTPTDHHVDHHDDEREALANLIPLGFSERDGVRNVYDAADRILAAGFHRTVQGDYYDEDTLAKVYNALTYPSGPLTPARARDVVNAMQNAGILFRERDMESDPSNVSEPGVSDISPAQMSVQGEPTPGKRLDPDFRADLVGYAKARIQDVWADVPEGVDAETLAQNVVAAQEFLWIARGFPVASAQGDPSLRDHVRNLTGASDAELDALGGFTGEPSDAAVKAALDEYLRGETAGKVRAMRAALRAAAAVQGGER